MFSSWSKAWIIEHFDRAKNIKNNEMKLIFYLFIYLCQVFIKTAACVSRYVALGLKLYSQTVVE